MKVRGTISVLELKVLSYIRIRKYFTKYGRYLTANFFKSSQTRLVYELIVEYHKKIGGDFINLKNLWVMVEARIDADDYYIYRVMLKKMKLDDDYDEKVIHATLVRFMQEELLKETITEAASTLGRNSEVNLEELKSKISNISSMNGKPKSPDYDYALQHDDRLKVTSDGPRLPTGLSGELDRHLKGGLGAGELGFILAPPGRGKTLALVNIGATAYKLGKRVLHVTLEIKARVVAKRYDCCLSDASTDDLMDNPALLTNKLKELQALGGKLIIKDYSYQHCGVGDLNYILESHAEEGETFDIIIVDYGDLMIPPEHYKDTRHEISKIYEELRIIAGAYNIPLWTASQTNRAALNKRVIKMDDIAEAFSKANIADLILALCQTDDEKSDKVMRIFVAKTRMSSINPLVEVIADPDRMIMKALRDTSNELEIGKKLHQIREKSKTL